MLKQNNIPVLKIKTQYKKYILVTNDTNKEFENDVQSTANRELDIIHGCLCINKLIILIIN